MAATTRTALDRSHSTAEGPNSEHFWTVKLDEENKTHTWKVEAEEDGDEDFITHTLFLKAFVLGEGAVDGKSNIVMLESKDQEGTETKGAVAHLAKGHGNLMSSCDLSINGKVGCTLSLDSGDGPVYVSGVYAQAYPREEPLDITGWATEDETADESVDECEEDEEKASLNGEEQAKATKGKKTATKRKASLTKAGKGKKQKPDTEEEDEDEEEDEEEEEMDEEEEEEEEEEEVKPTKKAKKTSPKDTKLKGAKTGKAKTPEVKKGKKATKAK